MAKTAIKIDRETIVSVGAITRHQIKRATQLAQDIGLAFVDQTSAPPGYLLLVGETRLELHSTLQPPVHGPVYVDFVHGKSAHRREFGGGRNQHLARAVGLKPGYSPDIIDATAGLGRDAFVLASLGCRIRMIEQCQPLAQLLEDGLLRARAEPSTSAIAMRMLLHIGNALDLIPRLHARRRPDVIYLDPMYPNRGKSAAVKKDARVLQALVTEPADSSELLRCALLHARKRVVVKRPGNAQTLGNLSPQACVKSPNTRYDIYIPG